MEEQVKRMPVHGKSFFDIKDGIMYVWDKKQEKYVEEPLWHKVIGVIFFLAIGVLYIYGEYLIGKNK